MQLKNLRSALLMITLLLSIIISTPVSARGQFPVSSLDVGTYLITGNAGVGGATLSFDDGGPQTATADADGLYSFNVTSGWAGIVTPSKAGYVFTPASRDYSSGVLSDQTGQDYSAEIKKQLSVGDYHTCGIQPGGALHCWGDGNSINNYGQLDPPAGSFVQVSSGLYGSCAIKTDSTVVCWGENSAGQSLAPTGTFTSIAAGSYMNCGLKTDGSPACWGDNVDGIISNIPVGVFTQISMGAYHACALRSDGTAYCWGWDDYKQVSDTPAMPFIQVEGGFDYTCGIKMDNTLICWGDNTYGQATPPVGTFTQINAGEHHACGIKTDGTVVCWGQDDNGSVNSPPAGTFTQIGAGVRHSCGLRSDDLWICWGGGVELTMPYRISGRTGAPGASLAYNDNGPQTATADGLGDYMLYLPDGWSGTISVAKDQFTFNPPNWSYSPSITSNQVGQNFTPTLTLTSFAAQDGWILESAKGSHIGGSLSATSRSIILGDDASNRQYRVILSFDTTAIGMDRITITSAVLKLYQNGQNGTDPFKVLGKPLLDLQSWSPFGGSTALQLKDFNAPALYSKVGGSMGHSGKWYSLPLTATGRARVAYSRGLMQFRLHFTLPTNNNNSTNWISFMSGNGPVGFRPQLVITYLPPAIP